MERAVEFNSLRYVHKISLFLQIQERVPKARKTGTGTNFTDQKFEPVPVFTASLKYPFSLRVDNPVMIHKIRKKYPAGSSIMKKWQNLLPETIKKPKSIELSHRIWYIIVGKLDWFIPDFYLIFSRALFLNIGGAKI